MDSNVYGNNDSNYEGTAPTGSLDNGPVEIPIIKVLRFYLFVFLLLVVFGSIFQVMHFEIGMILTQLLLILLPSLWFWQRYRSDKKVFARLQPLGLRFVPVIILLSAAFWLMNVVIASGLVFGLMELGYEPIEVLTPPQTLGQFLIMVAVISLAAGVCEEVLFRGTIMPALESHGTVPAVVFSALLFALFHVSFLNLFSTFMLGLVIAVVVIKTGSLWGGILYHILNNFYATLYLYLAGQEETATEIDPQVLPTLLIVFIIALVGAYFGLRILQKHSSVKPILKTRNKLLPSGWFNWPFAVAIIIFLALAFMELAVGFSWI